MVKFWILKFKSNDNFEKLLEEYCDLEDMNSTIFRKAISGIYTFENEIVLTKNNIFSPQLKEKYKGIINLTHREISCFN